MHGLPTISGHITSESQQLRSHRSLIVQRDLESIVDRLSEFLLAPDVTLRGLHRRVTKKKLNLFELPTEVMAEASATAAQIVRR